MPHVDYLMAPRAAFLPRREFFVRFVEHLFREKVVTLPCAILEGDIPLELPGLFQRTRSAERAFKGKDHREVVAALESGVPFGETDVAVWFKGFNWPRMRKRLEKIEWKGNGEIVLYAPRKPATVPLIDSSGDDAAPRPVSVQLAILISGENLGTSLEDSLLEEAFREHIARSYDEYRVPPRSPQAQEARP